MTIYNASAADGATQRSMATINITPLVDVMLVLLVIFMIAAPIATRVIPLSLPQAGPPAPLSEPIRLRIEASGETFWNGNPAPLAALRKMMQTEARRDPGSVSKLQIDASGDADYQVVAEVLAAAEGAGLEQVGFVRR